MAFVHQCPRDHNLFSYNALGERVKKSGPGGTVIFAYDEEGHLIGEYNSALA
jgi:YD repeat-containing protein